MSDLSYTKEKPKKSMKVIMPIAIATVLLLVSFQIFNKTQVSTSANGNNNVWESSWQPKTNANVCKPSRPFVNFDQTWFKSQSKEDRRLLKWFGSLCGGTYLEMGALDGVRFSNSHVFNKGLDWKGLMIEGSPKNFKNLERNRQNELFNVHAAICDKEQMLHWVDPSGVAVGGFQEFAAESFQKKWWTEELIKEATLVKCRPLKDVLFETVGSKFFFDFFSLDIEGAEYEALTSLNFDLVSFGIIFVESDENNELKNMVLRSLLVSNGYTFIDQFARSYWFINNDFVGIYKDVIH